MRVRWSKRPEERIVSERGSKARSWPRGLNVGSIGHDEEGRMKRHRTKNHEHGGKKPWGWMRFRSRAPKIPHPDLEPQHDQPWVPTNGLTDGVRRSPRE
jgi:hypothetical protein